MKKKTQITTKIKATVKQVNRENAAKVLLAERMDRRYKYIILGLTALLVGFGVYVGIVFVMKTTTFSDSRMQEIDIDTYLSYNQSKTKEVVYVATKGSEINQDYEKNIMQVVNKRKTSISYLDLGVLRKRHQLVDFMKANDFTKDTYTEPMLLVFENGQIIDSLVGTVSKTKVKLFLDLNRIE